MALRSLILSSLLFVASVAAADHKIFDSHSKHQRRQNNQPWLQCNPGQYYDSNLAACTSCPAGSYNREPRQTSCRLARAGYYVPNSGATDETPCQAGTYTSTQGRTSCDLCPPGAKCPNSALAQPQLCSPGTYNSQSGQRDCASCQPGYFNSVQGATGCCACCAGWLNENPRLTNCRLCPNQTPYSSPGCGSTGCCSKTMGMYAPVSQCNQSGRNCPITFTTGPSNVVRRSYIKSHTCSQLGFKACPVYKRHGLQLTVSGYDCVDVYNDLESCGGCADSTRDGGWSNDGGRDCSQIPNVAAVFCDQGRCVIGSCQAGYTASGDGQTCVSEVVYGHLSSLGKKRDFRLGSKHQKPAASPGSDF
ncbi:hypothetical protein HGRIS_000018 [Hohenbuehelia grisea]|uniref:Tyrosine-protein kinase ephrin type A/B receptor-like domain-containing protein n=1 Tax=Hohenbuehelia grisea TaxID=104357 RepID=A0ABR3JQL6_9AGAR